MTEKSLFSPHGIEDDRIRGYDGVSRIGQERQIQGSAGPGRAQGKTPRLVLKNNQPLAHAVYA
jgi:hypothetical protein